MQKYTSCWTVDVYENDKHKQNRLYTTIDRIFFKARAL